MTTDVALAAFDDLRHALLHHPLFHCLRKPEIYMSMETCALTN